MSMTLIDSVFDLDQSKSAVRKLICLVSTPDIYSGVFKDGYDMLTATCALGVIAIEQKNARRLLSLLEKDLQSAMRKKVHGKDIECAKAAFIKLIQFDKYFRARKVGIYIIPAVRKATMEMDALLVELEALSAQALNIVRSLCDQMQLAVDYGALREEALLSSMERYCQRVFEILAKEEEELFPVAQRFLSLDDWFDIAVECISDEALVHDRMRSRKRQTHGNSPFGFDSNLVEAFDTGLIRHQSAKYSPQYGTA